MTEGVQNHSIQLIVGLGNPGGQYENTRHNAGFWFVEQMARVYGVSLQAEKKFFGYVTKVIVGEQEVRLLTPSTFMNCSGRSVSAISSFFKIPVQSILVVHDELDFPPGIGRFKLGGGHGGHNGLRNIISSLANDRDFQRLRIGIGHPGNSKDVVNYVLQKPSVADRQKMDSMIDEALQVMPDVLSGGWRKAVQQLHNFSG
ncbi:MAG: aminoacyl-tRNA hydrolase [Candidatus Endonucleobacter bathymodioli]|uniref:Peptidyl-tRNA hydrolase n=1 Tax=Candidatus Endonucleibacter bathymodioli TaxID=539814 RepID=A0AA90SME4_9GAMM|nr:aminoacyl-tRNA hydrolase [Candidatus Endonucleobacter bathymodioli]